MEMKRPSEKFILTVIFYTLIFLVMGAVLVMKYRGTSAINPSELPNETPAPTFLPSATPQPGVELEHFLSILGDAGVRVTKTDDPLVYYVRDPDRAGRMRLTLSETDGLIYAASLDFLIGSRPTPTPSLRFSNKLWGLMGEHKKDETEALNRSLEKIIHALSKALLQKNTPSEATVLSWYDGAVDAKDKETAYEDKAFGTVFSASSTLVGSDSVLRLMLSVS